MQTHSTHDVPPAALAAFGIAFVLAAIAIYNYATGVYGGAVVSSIGTVVAALLGSLTQA